MVVVVAAQVGAAFTRRVLVSPSVVISRPGFSRPDDVDAVRLYQRELLTISWATGEKVYQLTTHPNYNEPYCDTRPSLPSSLWSYSILIPEAPPERSFFDVEDMDGWHRVGVEEDDVVDILITRTRSGRGTCLRPFFDESPRRRSASLFLRSM